MLGQLVSFFSIAILMLANDALGQVKPTDASVVEADARRVVFLTNGDDPFWDVCQKGLEYAAKEFKIEEVGLRLVVDKSSEFRADKQLARLKQYATESDIAAIAISPLDSHSRPIYDALRVLRDDGVKVICVDTDMDRRKFRDARFAFIGTDNVIAGEELGRAARGLRPNGGRYATFVGVKATVNARERVSGFARGAGMTFKSLDSMEDHGDARKAYENVADTLTRHAGEVDALVGIWAYNAHAIVKAVDDLDVHDKQTILVFDAAERALKHMEDGKIDAMIVQNPFQMGQLSVQLMVALEREDHKEIAEMFADYDADAKAFKTKDGDKLNSELRIVVPNDDSPLKEEMFHPDTRFYYYKDFRKWLDDRGLGNS